MYVVKQLFIQQTTTAATNNQQHTSDDNTNTVIATATHTQDTQANTMEIGAIRLLYPLTNRVSIKV